MINFSFWDSRNVLVTGHTGFKGSWISLLLTKLNANVFGCSLPVSEGNYLFNAANVKSDLNDHFEGDIRDLTFVEKCVSEVQPSVIFHLAAQPLVGESYLHPLYTWETNVIGTLNVLESLRTLKSKCAIVFVTTDKVYKNNEKFSGYNEEDQLGGNDLYSSSKAASELVISSWRSSFCGNSSYQYQNLRIATARSGNVIGGGDFACNRLIPDLVRSLQSGLPVEIRNPASTRPWQHVLDPLCGYLLLAETIFQLKETSIDYDCFNFGPGLYSNKPVQQLVDEVFKIWPGSIIYPDNPNAFHEAKLLDLHIDKAYHLLGWRPKWNFETSVSKTIRWYSSTHSGASSAREHCEQDIESFMM